MAGSVPQPVKFTFERVFGDTFDADNARLSEEEISAMRDEAYSAGFKAAQKENASRIADLLTSIAKAVQSFHSQLSKETARLKREAGGLALIAARKLAAASLRAHPLSEIKALIEEALEYLPRKTIVLVTVNDGVLEDIEAYVASAPCAQVFDGKIIFKGARDIAVTDCRLEWADGESSRDMGVLEQQIDALFSSHLTAETDEVKNDTEPESRKSGETAETEQAERTEADRS